MTLTEVFLNIHGQQIGIRTRNEALLNYELNKVPNDAFMPKKGKKDFSLHDDSFIRAKRQDYKESLVLQSHELPYYYVKNILSQGALRTMDPVLAKGVLAAYKAGKFPKEAANDILENLSRPGILMRTARLADL